MLGIALLVFSILLYISGRKKISLLFFLSFMSDGLQILTDSVIGVKNMDLAFIYSVVICLYSFLHEKKQIVEDKWLRKSIDVLFVFLLISTLYSYLHYGFTWYQILQGGRHLFLFISYYFICKVNFKDFQWIFQKLFFLTFVISILYTIQVLTGLPVLPYGDSGIDASTGLYRYFNAPTFLVLFLYITVLFPKFIKSKFSQYAPFVFLSALFCTLGRTFIVTTLFFLLVGLIMKGQASKVLKSLLIIGICILPFIDILIARMDNEGDTESDLEAVFSSDFKDYAQTGIRNGGTMTYRLAWVYERMLYLRNRPLGENIFGLGMISDSQWKLVLSKYHFATGIITETGEPAQLRTPDIAYGNMIAQFGYVGSILLLGIWGSLLVFAYKNKKKHPLGLCIFLLVISNIVNSMSGSYVSETKNLVIYFLIVTAIINYITMNNHESNSY